MIKEVKALIPGLNLMEVSSAVWWNEWPSHLFFAFVKAKKFVESLPKVLKENLPKEEAEKLQTTFKTLGANVKLE